MSVNTSSSSNGLLLPPPLSSSYSSLCSTIVTCFSYGPIFFTFTCFSATNILLLFPLCFLVLYLGLQRRRKRHSVSIVKTSHSDIFTYHMAVMEMIGIFGCGLYCCGVLVNMPQLMELGVSFFTVTANGQIFLHILTCVDRHLAIVHPITYLHLKNKGGVRIRNVTIGCTWLLFLGAFGLTFFAPDSSISQTFFLSILSVVVVSFCSLSVLRALIRPGPGAGGRDRERVNQSKMRAFHTIMAIMGALQLRFGGHLLVTMIYSSKLTEEVKCGMLVLGIWFCLPSSLVLPLLFLHRAGKLRSCKNKPKSGQESEQNILN